MYQNVVLEERTVKVLALLGVLAFLGMALMPAITGDGAAIYAYASGKNMNPGAAYGLLFTGLGLMKASDFLLIAEVAGCASAGVGAAVLVGIGIGVIA